MRVAVAAELC